MTSHLNAHDSFIRPSERPFLRRIEDWIDQVNARSNWVLTDFLTPREQILLSAAANRVSMTASMYGGYEFAERRRALLMPGDWHPEPQDFQIAVLAIQLDARANSHGSMLGSVLGTGIDRRKVGDIQILQDAGYVLTTQDVSGFLLTHWHQVGRESVVPELVTRSVAFEEPRMEHAVISAASYRADAVLAQACHFSRGQAQDAIAKGWVSLNFTELEKPDELLAAGDILSIRGFGRVKVIQDLGTSKKERHRIEVGVIRSRTR
ncbi:YlmH/Sll1252 family protein [Alicyclobacillus tolerans]|uniref:YlmH family RNA-binding protein n=1 Tax=Alicyclobacillus tolerans TaxID=90970 RepID=UPI001F348CF8|nr:YlmH/Sll1252 family protein [Alicyclobacillus tolerans]MCF8564451.1 YlmH/Sll1252 family protein [Alicyclobacillus tolerans]